MAAKQGGKRHKKCQKVAAKKCPKKLKIEVKEGRQLREKLAAK